VVRLVTGNQGIASTQLVYTRKVGDKWELVVSDYDGYNPRALVRQTTPLLSPRWMDRNQAVVYTTFRDGKADLYVRYVAQGKSKPIASYRGTNTAAEWSQKNGLLLAALSKDGNTEVYSARRAAVRVSFTTTARSTPARVGRRAEQRGVPLRPFGDTQL
jgi:TolB protein